MSQATRTHLPAWTRRDLWHVGAVSIVGRSLLPLVSQPAHAATTTHVTPRGGADCVIFLNLVGSPSQMDTLDVKEGKWTPSDLDIRTTKQGVRWPYWLLPLLGDQLDTLLPVRSMAAWETLHNLAQYYQQVGHQYTPARGAEMPSIGSAAAYEPLPRAKGNDLPPPPVSKDFPAGGGHSQIAKKIVLSTAHP